MSLVLWSILIILAVIIPAILDRKREYVLPFPKKYREILKKYFTYYIALTPKERVQFERRVMQFMRMKKFIPRQMKEVSIEMKILISACAIQLTFGLPRVYLRHFNKILVYPDNYYSTINQTYHKGEVNPRYGIIVLSWKAFIKGYIDKEGINLGLHEMAHALHLENRIMEDESYFDRDTLKLWKYLAHHEIEKIRSSKSSFFREYAAVDEHELFAVAVENFFERPTEFKANLPELYGVMVKLLNQDMSNEHLS